MNVMTFLDRNYEISLLTWTISLLPIFVFSHALFIVNLNLVTIRVCLASIARFSFILWRRICATLDSIPSSFATSNIAVSPALPYSPTTINYKILPCQGFWWNMSLIHINYAILQSIRCNIKWFTGAVSSIAISMVDHSMPSWFTFLVAEWHFSDQIYTRSGVSFYTNSTRDTAFGPTGPFWWYRLYNIEMYW